MNELMTVLLESSDEDAKIIIKKRLDELKEDYDEDVEEKVYGNSSRDGFIGKNVKLTPVFDNDYRTIIGSVLPIYFDDEEIYFKFLEFLKQQDEYLRNNASKRLDFFLFLLLKFESELLGHAWKVDIGEADSFHTKFDILGEEVDTREKLSIKDFYGKNIAACFERSIIAQNILTFFGIDSSLILGELGYKSTNKEDEKHAFNVFRYKDKEYLLDVTNTAVFSKDDDSSTIRTPLVMPFKSVEETFYFDDSFIKNFLGLSRSGFSIRESCGLEKLRYTIPKSFLKRNGTSY